MKRYRGLLATVALVLAVAVVPAGAQWAAISTNSITQADASKPIRVDASTQGFAIGASGTALQQLVIYTVAITPGSQATATCAPQAFTVTGITTADKVVLLNFPATGNATGYGAARASAANTISQVVCNPSAGALTPAAGTFMYLAIR